ncbi:twin-arginine translocase subunit TatC [Akkermansiaceae bacterium]|nr:twin-arginine translocase subunit TatC [Akkermansiaceae bacterium]
MYLLKKVFELREKAHSDHEKPFLEHLEDLRVMITRVVVTLLVSMIVCFTFQEQLMHVLRAPAEKVIFDKQQETMPDAKAHPGITVPTVETWDEAKAIERIAAGLDEGQRAAFYRELGKPDMEFHARSVALLRAAKALPEEKREGFVRNLGVDGKMVAQLLALIDSDPDVDASAGSNIKMMSALKPTEPFMLSMKLAFFAGIVLAFPLLLMFVLQFVLPGLHENERKILWPAMGIGFGLFLSGVLFAYFFVLPRALLFFFDWGAKLGVSNDWRIGEYITFATQFTLLFGLSFELPVVVMVMVKLGLLSYETMSRTRSYAILAIYIAAAVITPTPDIMTLNLMALPMLLLYEMCIWLAWFDRKKARQKEAEEEAELRERRRQWMIQDNERAEAAGHGHPDHEGDATEAGDHGWHDGYHHDEDHHWHDEYHDRHHGLPGDEEWTEPDDAVTGDDIPEEEKKRMNDAKGDE